jgi:hypothetical protein
VCRCASHAAGRRGSCCRGRSGSRSRCMGAGWWHRRIGTRLCSSRRWLHGEGLSGRRRRWNGCLRGLDRCRQRMRVCRRRGCAAWRLRRSCCWRCLGIGSCGCRRERMS